MTPVEEFKVRNTAGKVLIVQKIDKGISFMDFGMTRLPKNFEGYGVKYTDQIAEPRADGSVRLSGSDDVFKRV